VADNGCRARLIRPTYRTKYTANEDNVQCETVQATEKHRQMWQKLWIIRILYGSSMRRSSIMRPSEKLQVRRRYTRVAVYARRLSCVGREPSPSRLGKAAHGCIKREKAEPSIQRASDRGDLSALRQALVFAGRRSSAVFAVVCVEANAAIEEEVEEEANGIAPTELPWRSGSAIR